MKKVGCDTARPHFVNNNEISYFIATPEETHRIIVFFAIIIIIILILTMTLSAVLI